MTDLISFHSIETAWERLAPIVRPTPCETVSSLSKLAHREVWIKPEQRQRTGSFKIRGAYNRISQLPEGSMVVAASAGNHAQGVALAASLVNIDAHIFMPANAALPKLDATRGYGATVDLVPGGIDDCMHAARQFASENNATYVPPFDDPAILAGQASVGMEIARECPPHLRSVIVPVGGGGLLAGIAAALHHTRPDIEVYGVEPVGAAAMKASLAAGKVVTLDEVATLADGIAVKAPSELTLAHVQKYVNDIVTVTDDEISSAVLVLLERAKTVVEPSGAAALAAVFAGKIPGSEPTCVISSGGNVDPFLLMRIIDHGMTAAGRYLVLRVVLPDQPGSLATLTTELARNQLNILTIEHHRSGLAMPINTVEVVAQVETRNRSHVDQVVKTLKKSGFNVTVVT